MNPIFGAKRSGMIMLVLLSVWLDSAPTHAAVIRGPYLQSGSPTGMVVRWRTDTQMIGKVRYGVDQENLNFSAETTSQGTDHQVSINGLTPDTRYYYSVGDDETPLMGGDDFYFRTSPTKSRPTRIWVLGDPQYGGEDGQRVQQAYLDYPGSENTDMWLALGDFALYTGTDWEFQEYFFNVFGAMMRKAVLWPTIGNHDAALSLEDFDYLRIFTLPSQGEAGGVPSGTSKYYSFNYGNIHCVSLDSITVDITAQGEQYQWLARDLASNTQKWLFAFFHVPPYSKGSHDSDYEYATTQMREVFVPLLESNGVDLVLTGHSHTYERSYLLNGHYGYSWTFQPSMKLNGGDGRIDGNGAYVKGSSSPTPHQGTVYIEAGTGTQARPGPFNHPAMFMGTASLGSLVIDVDDNSLTCRFLRDTGAIDDYFTLLKGVRSSNFKVATEILPSKAVQLSWGSVTGQVFHVSRRTSLDAPWSRVATSIVATNSITRWRDLNPPSATSFYRLEN